MRYIQPFGVTDPDGAYQNGNAQLGIEGSIIPAEAVEHPMREIVAVLAAAGLTPDENNLAQLVTAIGKLSTNTFVTQAKNFVVITDQKANGTPGGVFTTGAWRTRDLNTVIADPGNLTVGSPPIVSLSSNTITLQPGKYVVEGSAPAVTVDTHKIRLQNTTDATTAIWGASENTTGAVGTTPDAVSTRSYLVGFLDLLTAKSFQLQHICQTTSTGTSSGAFGFGTPSTYGLGSSDGPETYSILKITKVG